MLAIERRNAILAKLQDERKVVVSELATTFNVTEETIRRDLDKLEKEGMAKKTYGGAVLSENLNLDLPYTVRKKANVEGKTYIAQVVSELIEDGAHIILDASTTALAVAQKIKEKNDITVITNSIEIILELSDKPGFKVLSTGGMLKEGSLALVGYQAERMIGTFHVDMAIVSCKGIDIEHGLTDSNEADAEVKKSIIKSSNRKILAVDSTKFDKISFTTICDFDDIDVIVTEKKPDDRWIKFAEQKNIDIIY